MEHLIPEMVIDPDFPFKHDKLKRDQFAGHMTNMVSSLSDGAVLALDARWGEGKTTFVHMWRAQMKKDGVHSIYIDAFKNDYADDAFLVIARNITHFLDEMKLQDSIKEDFKQKALKLGVNLLSWGTKTSVRILTSGVFHDFDPVSLIKGESDDSSSLEKEVLRSLTVLDIVSCDNGFSFSHWC